MRVLIVNEYYTPNLRGGAEVSCQLLAESLLAQGHEVFVMTTSDNSCIKKINGVTVYYEKIQNVYWPIKDKPGNFLKCIWHLADVYNIFFRRRIKDVICEVSPDVVNTNVISSFSCIVWSVAKSLGFPVVHTMRDYYLLCHKATMFNGIANCESQCKACHYSSLVKCANTSKVDAVVGISRYILNKHLAFGCFPKAKIKAVIYNTVNKVDIAGIKREKVIGFLGTVSKSKGVERLIRDFTAVDHHRYTLEIAGSRDESFIAEITGKYNMEDVRFIGRVKANDFLQRISLLVVPSLWQEPFGRICIEAVANQCPVFVSNRGGMPEIINTQVGRVFSLEDDNGLTSLLSEFIEGKMTFDFENFDMSRFSNEVMAKKYIEVFEGAIASKCKGEK